MDEYIYRKSAEFKLYEAFITDAKSFKKAITALKEIPLVDVQPVVHGHWIKKPLEETICNGVPIYAMFCSVCDWMGNEIDNYCSNCGAKMEVDDEYTD